MSTTIDYVEIERNLQTGYDAQAQQYRRDDEVQVQTGHHRHLSRILHDVCFSFPQAIRVLDVGCGTGRYFHCVRNATELMGVDISPEMLRAAETPVCSAEITVPMIHLKKLNAYLASFPPESFDLIYSFGMFGHGCPVTPGILKNFHEWLRPGGKLMFDTVDFAGLPVVYRAKRTLRSAVLPMLPAGLQSFLHQRERRLPFYGMTKRGLELVVRQSPFTQFQIESHVCDSPLWKGRHLECLAVKPPSPSGCQTFAAKTEQAAEAK